MNEDSCPRPVGCRLTIPAAHERVFADANAMKDHLRESMRVEPYDVRDFYYKEGYFQSVARASWFENLTLGIICTNAVWISVDTDLNDAPTLNEADPLFIIVENIFCLYFLFEWIVRFGAFECKSKCITDRWFAFDTCMVLTMIAETWALFLYVTIAGGAASLVSASSLKLMKLSRIARLARLLRSMPELLVLIKGMVSAIRAVFFTLLLLAILVFVFSVFFRQFTEGTDLAEAFPTLPQTMHTLIRYGVLLDSVGRLSLLFTEHSYICLILWYFFILLSAVTIMNMLIGVACEVIQTIAAEENKGLIICYVKETLEAILAREGYLTNDLVFTKEKFLQVLEKPETAQLLTEVDVNVFALVDLVDTIFRDYCGEKRTMTFVEVVEVILEQRTINEANLRDMTDLRRFVTIRMSTVSGALAYWQKRTKELTRSVDAQIQTMGELVEKFAGHSQGTFNEEANRVERELRTKTKKAMKTNSHDTFCWHSGVSSDSSSSHEVP
eukprot:CAMPEP_0117516926 /NCGR_PEP_ID=MMETSP0784-20121206/31345_1 /TAXON_ID=39447 /ORGANISM="" /LENGTH=498 /DNA_ID=CAMNT_0005312785 /DNA_START=106 /DNA_END=1599 /DNA_ORIENTATION=+